MKKYIIDKTSDDKYFIITSEDETFKAKVSKKVNNLDNVIRMLGESPYEIR